MPGRVLIVEDNEHDLELARVSDLRYEVQVARDGQEALDLLRAQESLPDLNRPRVNGHEVLAAVKGDPVLRRVPVVVFTTSNLPEDRAACGAVDDVVKPEGFGAFVETINRLGRQWLTLEPSA